VWEYRLRKGDPVMWHWTSYWLFFHDGSLVQWGEAGDWQEEADRIYEVRFR
jgi:hypothetical protein